MRDVICGLVLCCRDLWLLMVLHFSMAESTWFVVRGIGVVSRLWSCLIVWRFFLSELKWVG